MKSLVQFVKTSIKGGVFMFLPLFFTFYLLKKVFDMLIKVAKPFMKWLKIDTLLGEVGLSLLIIFMLLFLCFLGGVLMRFRFFKSFNEKAESIISTIFPQYDVIKGKVDEKIQTINEDPKKFVKDKIHK
ncbi:hypothetical protein [Flavobacterium sp.]|jgi:uncharacterized membrane protein|uniref:hypothetical protein n=1 Tax=Flavobacterium sp. TaxID=239 RepID=UPI0037BE5C2A